mmetsp:Transcript_22009/g.66009  ORF Transcript_22009/g.66009 Transcript_22009/m.66009 type:complete len:2411 (+) Transcript_22009:238-7470(+)|eukprot:CAMPEP_0206300498 /NCGR_PEP_ID=MMETSP0106_2-20121207/7731_1 /ASSEMBLY_ACC=CAM_ASM_000206 /TAXON_ID=81532 /ORGANISM="Acanthoeca-like sp., Strain 10tr" /LENGTH=2410 /DNA_ID=CAMNT_0053731221 /DNA_START=168 /DNA_END=7400 /DNA_ORIENTATION=+
MAAEPHVPSRGSTITRGKYSYASTTPNPLVRSASLPARVPLVTQGPVFGVATAQRNRGDSKDWRHNSAEQFAWRRTASSHSMVTTRPSAILRKTRVETMIEQPRWKSSTAPIGKSGGSKPQVKSAMPAYDSLSDPAMADYWARKFGWTVAGTGGKMQLAKRPSKSAVVEKSGGLAEYRLEVTTSARHPAPAGGKKSIELFGAGGSTGELPLQVQGASMRRLFSAGATNTVVLTAPDVGVPQRIRLVNSSDAKIHGWYCQAIVVFHVPSGNRVVFDVDAWLSKHEGDCSLELIRKATKTPKGRSRYTVRVTTGALQPQRCTSNVYITLFGSNDKSSGRLRLSSNTPCFECGHTNVFTVATLKIGRLQRMRIEHDNSGDFPTWFLEDIVVTHMGTGSTYTFHAGLWFAEDRGDGRIARELHAHSQRPDIALGKCELLVEVFTGDVKYGGTKASVSIQIFGDSDSSVGPITLRTDGSHSPFERGVHATFPLEVDDVGIIRRIRIGHDNSGSGPSWFLKQVRIKHLGTGQWYTFPCERWFDRDRDDGHISRELFSEADVGELGAYAASPYHIFVTTSKQRNAGTDSKVFAEIFGVSGKTGKFPLENNHRNFTRGRTDEFVIPTINVGELTGITLEHDNTGSGPAWLVEKVAVACPKLGKVYHASVGEWLTTDNTLNPKGQVYTRVEFNPEDCKIFSPKGTWVCTTYTSDQMFASTSANVYIQVYGENGKSGEVHLQNKTHAFNDNFKRGAVDKFQIELESIGMVYKLRVWHDNSGGIMGATWALDKITLKNVESGAEYTFEYNGWLSHRDGDGEIVRELPATGITIKDPLSIKKYTLRVFTGQVKHAGTDANVYAVLFGTLGDTGPRPLRKSATHRDKFEAGHEDVFTIEAVDLGSLERLQIGHDNRGLGPSWYLDRVTVEIIDEIAPPVEFPCGRWLAKSEDDGQIERTLYLSSSNKTNTTYTIRVFTGDIRHAGTDANVYIVLFGENGDSGRIALRNSLSHSDKFERAMTDVFKIETAEFGCLQKIRVGHDNSGIGPGWFLDRVEIEVMSLGEAFTFNCGRWLCRTEDDNEIERELLLDNQRKIQALAAYECNVYTADVRHAGTDARVYIVMFGKDGRKTDEVRLTNNTDNFERSHRDTFRLELDDIGPPMKLAVRHDNTGFGPSWCLSRIEMHNLKDNVIYTFCPPLDTDEPGVWLTKDKGLTTDLTVSKVERVTEDGVWQEEERADFQKTLELTTYTVFVHTMDEHEAGTDANVYLVVTGTLGNSGERALNRAIQVRGDNYHRDKFERGHTDEFTFDCLNLGELQKLQIRHDNRGRNPSWLLGSVDISDGTKTYTFPCNKWLSRTKGDKLLHRELPVRRDEDIGGAIQGTVTRYDVRVYTSDIRHAGTDARMHLIIMGVNGDTGKIHLKTSADHRDKFERGNMDSFVVESVGVGEIKKIRIGHDNSGMSPDWHCEKVEISVPMLGKEYIFECDRWFGRKRDDGMIERILLPSKSWDTLAKTPYEVQIYTSDIDNGGTSGRMTMTVFGKDVLSGQTTQRFLDFSEAASQAGFLTQGHGTREGVPPDVVQKDLEDFGEPFKLTVMLDAGAKKSRASWHLHQVVLVNKISSARYEFPCGKWFCSDKSKDGGQMTRSLEIGLVQEVDDFNQTKSRSGSVHLDRVKYIVKVMTGDIYQAGTDARVFITLYGEHGDSGERPLHRATQMKDNDDRMHRDLFERGHVDAFFIDDLDLGSLQRVAVRHDNSSWKKSWYLDNIVVEAEGTGNRWLFPCQKWFSRKKGDNLISREIPVACDAAYLTKLQQELTCEVSEIREQIDKCSVGPAASAVALDTQEDQKRRLLALELRLDDVNQQLAEQVDGVASRGELATYEVTIKTGDKAKAGTTAEVSCELMGHSISNGSSHVRPTTTGLLHLPSKPESFEKGVTAVMSVKALDIGELVEVRIGHDDKSAAAAWFLESISIRIQRPTSGIDPRTYNFECNSWLSTNSTWKTLIADSVTDSSSQGAIAHDDGRDMNSHGHTYRLEILTGDVDRAGTDARVTLVLTGVLGESPPLRLRESTTYRDKFERGHTDVFVFNDVDDLGKLTHARVWHDNHGFGPSWYLEHLTVFDEATESKFEFPCNKWLSKSHGDKLLERVLPCTEYVMNGYVVGYDIAIKVAGESMPCSEGPIVKLFGDDRESGELNLPLAANSTVGAGQEITGTFDLPALGNLLEVCVKLPIRKDGIEAKCNLEHVKVTERRLGTTWSFLCDAPVQYGGPYVVLRESAVKAHAADAAEGGELVTYEIRTATSKIRGAGTDARVHIELWGRKEGQIMSSGRRQLKTSSTHRDKFEPGHEDVFKIEAIDLGILEKLKIEHDASGWKNSDWHLDSVRVRDVHGPDDFVVFPCGQWLSKRREGKELWKELFPKLAEAPKP